MTDTRSAYDFEDAGGDDILAAEYVLGVLSADEQAQLARRADLDPAFASLVAHWDDRLLPIAGDYQPQDLPPAIKRALDLRLFGQAPPPQTGFWASLAFWRGLAGVATAAFLLAVTLPALQPADPSNRLTASLTADGSGVTYLAVYDAETGRVTLAHLTGEPVEGRDFQLWVAHGSDAPVSLGVIPAATTTQVSLTDATRDMMTTAAHIAISLEPQGGSPTGQPTGPVLAVGDLLDI